MGAIALAANALASLGRQGTRAVAISIFLSLIVPQVSEFIRPAVGPSIFIMLVLAFLRVEPSALHGQFTGRPFRLLLTSVAVMMVATPLILGALYAGMGDTPAMRGLYVALILQAAAPPIMSAPAFVALLALDLPLALATLVLAILFTPIGAPFFAAIFVGDDLPIDALSLALRLAFFLGGSFLVARVLRRFIGDERIRAWREHIDGLNLIALFVFALAIMGVVTYTLLSDPLRQCSRPCITNGQYVFLRRGADIAAIRIVRVRKVRYHCCDHDENDAKGHANLHHCGANFVHR